MGRELCPNPGAELKLTFLAKRIFLIQIRPYSYSYQSSNCNYTNFCRRWTLYHVKNKTDNKISSVDALRELRHIDLVKWHTSRKFNCRVARCYFYVGALLTKTTFFLLKLRVPAVAANEVYMCKALISVQLNLCRGTVKNFKYQNKGRMLQKSRRQSILLPLTNTTMEKSLYRRGKRLYWKRVLPWAPPRTPRSIAAAAPGSRAAALKRPFWRRAMKRYCIWKSNFSSVLTLQRMRAFHCWNHFFPPLSENGKIT